MGPDIVTKLMVSAPVMRNVIVGALFALCSGAISAEPGEVGLIFEINLGLIDVSRSTFSAAVFAKPSGGTAGQCGECSRDVPSSWSGKPKLWYVLFSNGGDGDDDGVNWWYVLGGAAVVAVVASGSADKALGRDDPQDPDDCNIVGGGGVLEGCEDETPDGP